MEKIKRILDAMEKQAIKENKADDFQMFCHCLKNNIFNAMLAGKYSKAEAEDLRDYIIDKERGMRSAL